MALPHPCRAYSPAAALRTGKACAPLLAARGSLATTPLLGGWLPSVTASRPRCAPPWTFRGSGHVLPQGPRPLGHLPQQHLSCPRGVRGGGPPFPPAPPPPLLRSLPGRRSRGEGEDSAEAPGSQGAAPRGCPAKGRPQTWVTCGDGQGACAFAFRTKIARAAGRRSCGAPFTILMNAAPRHRDAGSPASAGRGGC